MATTSRAIISTIGAIALAGGALMGCSSNTPTETNTNESAAGSAETQKVRLGVVGASDPYWAVYEEAVESELGIDLEIVDFGEYTLPNPALAAGELDLNQFQHIIYLAQHNVASGDDLVPIGSTATYPLGLHSLKHKSVDEIPEGATIAIPNDVTNKARALLVLQQAGLVELKDGGSTLSTANDVLPGSKVTVTELDAHFTATSLQDVDGAVINNDFVTKAGLNFDDALFLDDPSDPSALPYVNIFATRAADKDNETYKKLVEIYHNTPAVLEGVQDVSGGTATITNTPAAELEASLTQVIEFVKSAQ